MSDVTKLSSLIFIDPHSGEAVRRAVRAETILSRIAEFCVEQIGIASIEKDSLIVHAEDVSEDGRFAWFTVFMEDDLDFEMDLPSVSIPGFEKRFHSRGVIAGVSENGEAIGLPVDASGEALFKSIQFSPLCGKPKAVRAKKPQSSE